MAAYAALVSLLNNIHTITNHPRFSTSVNNEQIQPLHGKTNFLLDFIEGNNYGGGSKEAQDLERKIASAAHAAEDVIESHIVDQIHAETPEASLRRKYLPKFVFKHVGRHESHRSGKPLDLQQVNEDMDAIIKETNQFKENHRLGEKKPPTDLAGPLMQSGETATTMVGLDAELYQLLDELTGYQSNRRSISIVGMGGTGKTTLAKNVYENLLIKEHFHVRAWATISQQINAQDILSKLLSSLGEFNNGLKDDDLGLRLHKTLSGRRYLIVLDDIWSVTAWDEVKRFFPNNSNGSRVLLTTRLSNVANDCGSSLFKINLLDEKNSWKLFCAKAFQNKDCPPDLREVGDEIVKLCKGLALSIVVIGGLLLKSPRTVRYWKSVAKDLKSIPYSKEKQESLDVLSLSYNHLPPHLKPCFLYMGAFKEGSEIRVSKMIKLWVVEGFIKPIESRVLEETAEGYIKDLIDRNLILIGGRCKNGKVGSCVIHDLLRDLCIKLAEQEQFFHLSKGGIQGTERRLVDDRVVERTNVKLTLTRSIMTQRCIKSSVEYRLLRVLDEAGFNSQANYYVNVNLRYLAHDIPSNVESLGKVPTSISHIWNLQTLIINYGFRCLMVMPVEIWKMGQLRHVECYKISLPCPPQSNTQEGLLVLENLQTLKTIVNLRLSEQVCKIIPNIKKLHLVYSKSLWGYDDSGIECLRNLHYLHKLEALNVSLSSISLLLNRELENLTASFPMSLKKLSLGWFKLRQDDMTMIGSLPQLEVLELDYIRFLGGGEWSPVDEQFLRLKFLKITSCDLYRWDAESSHFPVLEKLILVWLDRLEEIPLSIGDIPTLQLIRVAYCSDSAASSAVRIKEDQLDNDGQIQVQVKFK